jgi:DNA-binding NtrC family response regulator
MRIAYQCSTTHVVTGHSARMRAVFDLVRIVSQSDSNVIITGESGTGKEVIARLLHDQGPRSRQPFVAVSCALFSETLIETELFGHERGAFTGAVKDKPGRFEMAHGGTLFLDDIDDVPLSMQVKLLRALQNRQVERVGGVRTIPVDVRIIAGAKHDVPQMVAAGRFREDLYFRLNVLPIALPPLRERREDLPLLVEHFLTRFAKERAVPVPELSPAVQYAFSRYHWPGNVRELENLCERIVQTCGCGTTRFGCLSESVLFGAANSRIASAAPPVFGPPRAVSLDDRLREVESGLIRWALTVTGGNKSKAAELLNIKRSTLADRIARCGISPAAVTSEGDHEHAESSTSVSATTPASAMQAFMDTPR